MTQHLKLNVAWHIPAHSHEKCGRGGFHVKSWPGQWLRENVLIKTDQNRPLFDAKTTFFDPKPTRGGAPF
jgi:hypothetical protein